MKEEGFAHWPIKSFVVEGGGRERDGFPSAGKGVEIICSPF